MKYEELPKWIQKYLSDNHEHLVRKTYHGDAYDVDGNITDKYDKWFDKNQKIYYDEDCVINLVEILISNYSTKTDVSKLKKEIEQLKNPIIKLKEYIVCHRNTYALFTTDKDVNILFINYERFQNEPKLYKIVDKLNYDYKVYLNKKNEIEFTTWNGLTLDITEENFSNFDIIKEFFQ